MATNPTKLKLSHQMSITYEKGQLGNCMYFSRSITEK